MVKAHPGCNFGFVTNIVDVDTKNNGIENWGKLTAEHGEPDTRQAETPTGGLHVYVKDVLAPSTAISGIDLKRADKGQCVAPGSYVVANGKSNRVTGYYKWGNSKPINSVPWIAKTFGGSGTVATVERGKAAIVQLDTEDNIARAVELLKGYADSPVKRGKDGKQTDGPAFEGDHGDEWTFQVAANVGDLGVSREMCLQLMSEHFDPACTPQWGERLQEKVNAAYNSRTTPPGVDTAEADFADVDTSPGEPDNGRRHQFKEWTFDEFKDLKPRQMLIGSKEKPVLIQRGLWMNFGLMKGGKTYFSLEEAFCIAFGLPFHGLPVIEENVVYSMAEGGVESAWERMQALYFRYEDALKAKGFDTLADVFNAGKFNLITSAINIGNKGHVKEFMSQLKHGPYGLAFLDTWARMLMASGGNDVNPDSVAAGIRGCDQIRTELDCTVTIVAHVGWSPKAQERPKGVIDQVGAIDGATFCRKDGTGMSAVYTAESMFQRHAVDGFQLNMNLKKFGPDLVLVPTTVADREKQLDADLAKTVAILRDKGGQLVPVDDWRDAVKEAGLWPTSKNWRDKWKRSLEKLVGQGVVIVEYGAASLHD